jgi:hypothetical protein
MGEPVVGGDLEVVEPGDAGGVGDEGLAALTASTTLRTNTGRTTRKEPSDPRWSLIATGSPSATYFERSSRWSSVSSLPGKLAAYSQAVLRALT